MGNLVDKEAVSFINSDLIIPRPPSAPQSPAPEQAGNPHRVAQIRTADNSSTVHNQEVTTVTYTTGET